MITEEELNTIRATSGAWCVSLSFPTRYPRSSLQEESIQLKNALHEAEQQLEARGLRRADASKLLAPAARLLDERTASAPQGKGLVLYVAAGVFRHWTLPWSPPVLTSVARRFSLKPILPLLSRTEPFFVLAISQHRVRLLSCTRFSCREVPLPQTPGSLPEALWADDPQRQLQFHTGAGVPSDAAGGRRPAMYHGHGVGIDDTKDRIVRYLREVDQGVVAALAEQRGPLVLASVKSLLPLYREVSAYPQVLEEGVWGNPEQRRDEELRDAALNVLAPLFQAAGRDAVARFHDLATRQRAVSDPKAVALAAADGRVEELFVTPDAEVWARVRMDRHAIELCAKDHPEAEELVDFSIRETAARAGRIHSLEPSDMPATSPLAATLRY